MFKQQVHWKVLAFHLPGFVINSRRLVFDFFYLCISALLFTDCALCVIVSVCEELAPSKTTGRNDILLFMAL